MSDFIPLCNAPLFVLAQVKGLLPLVERIAPANTSDYTDDDERLTERGWRGVELARKVAEDAFAELEPLAGWYRTPTPEHSRLDKLLFDAAHVAAVVGAALAGLDEAHPHPSMVTQGLVDLLKRLQGDARAAREVEMSVFDHDRQEVAHV